MKMTVNVPQIIDANINRVSEGLRVIEDYVRFISQDEGQTKHLSAMRKRLNMTENNKAEHLFSRDTTKDMRAKEVPQKRVNLVDLLTANFKRVEEGLRVLEEYTGISLYNEARYDAYDLERDILLPLMKKMIPSGIYLISDEVEVLKKGLEWGVSLVQLRQKDADKETLLNKAYEITALAKAADIPFIVNDFLDIAQLVAADGLHTGQDDISVSEQRKLLGPHKIIGRTTHTLEQGLKAEADGADYVSVGPIWETPSKPNRDGIGFEYLEAASDQLSIPFVAIGGVNKTRLHEVLRYKPPLIGLIRDYEAIPEMQAILQQSV
ncbi:thiamine phosphate synthase [Candidatus Marinamargulisbacteria bacterium SCGC AAA071-K20]|nr:thiamine phosphate synthase [Candidatus Marinamargulisbacteria bacterium SCGC AAA071-K20]